MGLSGMMLTPVRTARPVVIAPVLCEKVSIRERKGGTMDMPSMEWFVIYKYLMIRKHGTERDGVRSLTRLETSAAGQKVASIKFKDAKLSRL